VDVTSLGYRTDLALLRLGGSEVDDRGDHLVIRTPHNPTFWWGNYLLLSCVPPEPDTDSWLDRFHTEFPAADHVALGFDSPGGGVEQLSAFAARGIRCLAGTVMQASAVHEPPRPNRDATYRQLTADADWAQSLELSVACNDQQEASEHIVFATQKLATTRALVDAGHGAWFGAFVDGKLRSQMGLFAASPGLARYQMVETHPDARGRGLAGTLVHHVGRYGFETLGAETLVMVADPEYVAIRVYRSVGFSDGENQLQAERPPTVS
jgi:ribosomal protein S18 acetylase RimI-like enzyme